MIDQQKGFENWTRKNPNFFSYSRFFGTRSDDDTKYLYADEEKVFQTWCASRAKKIKLPESHTEDDRWGEEVMPASEVIAAIRAARYEVEK